MFADSGQHHRHDGRDGGTFIHGTPGDHQLHPVATLPEDLGHLFAAHAEQVGVPDPQDVVPAAQAAILRGDRLLNSVCATTTKKKTEVVVKKSDGSYLKKKNKKNKTKT